MRYIHRPCVAPETKAGARERAGQGKFMIVQTLRALILAAGALLDWRTITFRDLTIQSGVALALTEPLTVHVLDLAGSLRAAVRAESRAIIRATGEFHGELEAPTLLVEDGAALQAALRVGAGRQVALAARSAA